MITMAISRDYFGCYQPGYFGCYQPGLLWLLYVMLNEAQHFYRPCIKNVVVQSMSAQHVGSKSI